MGGQRNGTSIAFTEYSQYFHKRGRVYLEGGGNAAPDLHAFVADKYAFWRVVLAVEVLAESSAAGNRIVHYAFLDKRTASLFRPDQFVVL